MAVWDQGGSDGGWYGLDDKWHEMGAIGGLCMDTALRS
jgi:hypothetical protein